jgi:homoserine dehydrogenase
MTTTQWAALDTRPRQASLPPLVLAGCGTVGGALLGLIRAGQGSDDAVRSVLVRDPERPRAIPLPRGRHVTDPGDLPVEGGATVVEALGGEEPALSLARRTLRGGGTFITANKVLVAEHGIELQTLARVHRGRFAFEASVGAAMPIVRLLRDLPPEAEVRQVEGILNGTSNYLLDALGRGARWEEALAEAQRLGFAEADPGRDIDGRDALDKASILGWLAFGVAPADLLRWRIGILPDPELLAREARRASGVPRLLARVRPVEGATLRIEASVHPCVALSGSEWAGVREAGNRAEVRTERGGVLSVSGPGAGGDATATALLTDLRDLRAPHPGPELRPGGAPIPPERGAENRHRIENRDSIEARHRAEARDSAEAAHRSEIWQHDPARHRTETRPSTDIWHLSADTRIPGLPQVEVRDRIERVLDRAQIERGRFERSDGRWRVRIETSATARVVLIRERLSALDLRPVLLRELKGGRSERG